MPCKNLADGDGREAGASGFRYGAAGSASILWATASALLYRTLFDDAFPNLFRVKDERISQIVRALPGQE